jgi:hypothetical protein
MNRVETSWSFGGLKLKTKGQNLQNGKKEFDGNPCFSSFITKLLYIGQELAQQIYVSPLVKGEISSSIGSPLSLN